MHKRTDRPSDRTESTEKNRFLTKIIIIWRRRRSTDKKKNRESVNRAPEGYTNWRRIQKTDIDILEHMYYSGFISCLCVPLTLSLSLTLTCRVLHQYTVSVTVHGWWLTALALPSNQFPHKNHYERNAQALTVSNGDANHRKSDWKTKKKRERRRTARNRMKINKQVEWMNYCEWFGIDLCWHTSATDLFSVKRLD